MIYCLCDANRILDDDREIRRLAWRRNDLPCSYLGRRRRQNNDVLTISLWPTARPRLFFSRENYHLECGKEDDGMWVAIEGYYYPYRINEDGDIQKFDRERWIPLKATMGVRRAEVMLRKADGGRTKQPVVRLMANAFLGGQRPGYAIIHKNGVRMDNSLNNLKVVERKEAGKYSGCSRRRSVEKIDRDGNVVALYKSIREAAKANYVGSSSVSDRCRGKVKDPFDYIGFSFRYEEGQNVKKRSRPPKMDKRKKMNCGSVFFNSEGELEDTVILQAFDRAKELYSDGAISEAADICLDIWDAVQKFDKLMQSVM